MNNKTKPENKRESLRQNELKNNPNGTLRDGFERGTGSGNLNDLVGGMGWKGTGILIIILLLSYIIYH